MYTVYWVNFVAQKNSEAWQSVVKKCYYTYMNFFRLFTFSVMNQQFSTVAVHTGVL